MQNRKCTKTYSYCPITHEHGVILSGTFYVIKISSLKIFIMDKELKNRSGSQSDKSKKNKNKGDNRRDNLPGSPVKSNKQTGGHERDDSSKGADKNTTKKQQNSI
jgi:hypothetical protein